MKPNHLIYDPERECYDLVLNGRVYVDCEVDSVEFQGKQTITQFFAASQYVVQLSDENGNLYQELLSKAAIDDGLIEYLSQAVFPE